MNWGSDILIPAFWAFIGAIFGLLVAWPLERIRDKRKVGKELESIGYIDITGDWMAAWQTSVKGEVNINTEIVELKQRGKTVAIRNREKSQENPDGGYLWSGTLHFFHARELLGWYFATKEENSSNKGMYYFFYDAAKKEFIGKWVGCSYDGPLMTGFCAIAKSRARALEILQTVMAKHPQHCTIIEAPHS